MQTQLYKCLFNVVITRLMFKSKNNCSVDLYLTHQAINKKIFFKCLLQRTEIIFQVFMPSCLGKNFMWELQPWLPNIRLLTNQSPKFLWVIYLCMIIFCYWGIVLLQNDVIGDI